MRHGVRDLVGLLVFVALGAAACGDGQTPLRDAFADASLQPDANQTSPDASALAPDARDSGLDGPPALVPTSACTVSTNRTPPFTVQLNFHNDGATTVFLRSDCVGLSFGISSCASAFRDRLGPMFTCGCSCDEASCRGDVACGACPAPSGVVVNPGDTKTVAWSALLVTEDDRVTFSCVRSRPLPAARYRVAIQVYDSNEAAMKAQGGRLITEDFDLPTPNDNLVVAIGGTAESLCDADPRAAAPVCTAMATRESPCDAGDALTWFDDGGLRLYGDKQTLTPPATYARQRTFFQETRPDLLCMAGVPRCSKDARVVTTWDVTHALADLDVQAAFAHASNAQSPLVFGSDTRPGDGSVLVVQKNNVSFAIGGPCTPNTSSLCARALPPGLAALAQVLNALDEQQFATPECAALGQ